ncbi:PAS domain S-box protein [Chitinophaga nivalis]|uniref:histidine kinase n=1 Tax=Chitinophaga nivalis TaxID=2991709 RepID=A0ABT3IG99_9BACT|nr:PAS domain S-box protein [Chitinophaga nivalis]MCW3467321.1 PAS domain S-box protein [Chitinophaga nivalis]MCW3482987.1 PAS domain S-box protein [Chitinophaga nivalis]
MEPHTRHELQPAATNRWEQESLYKQVLDSLPAAIYTCNTTGHITIFNEAATLLWGRTPVIGVDMWCGSWKIFYPDGNPMPLHLCPMAVALKEQRAVTGEEIIIEKPDGTRRHILPNPQPIFDKNGQFQGAINMLVDITTQKADKEKAELLAAIVESSGDAIVSKTLDGIIVSWNKAAEKMFGYSAAEMIGQSILRLMPPDKLEEEQQIIAHLKKGIRVEHFETQRLNKKQELIEVSLTISPVINSQGKIIGASKIARDITDAKQAALQLRETEEAFRGMLEKTVQERTRELTRLNAELEKSNQELEQFAYIASHDLQEPLRKIQTFSGLILQKPQDPANIEKYFPKINASAEKMSQLIYDLLNYSRLSAHDIPFEPIHLETVMNNVLTEFDLLIEQKKARITCDPLPVIPGISLQLHQLFRNLIGNALKFVEKDPAIHISVTNDNDYTHISIQDNGIGFEQKYADQVFNIFKRLNTHDKYSGTGIGLAVCKKITENHHGKITALSEPGQGAVFNICLPLYMRQ